MNDEELKAHPLSAQLRERLAPLMRSSERVLRAKYPSERVRCFEQTAGSLTAFQAFEIGLECSFDRDVPGYSDNVCVQVTVCHLDAAPRINADVGWGSDEHAPPADARTRQEMKALMPDDSFAGWTSADDWPEATPEVLARLEADLPRLLQALERIVAYATTLLG